MIVLRSRFPTAMCRWRGKSRSWSAPVSAHLRFNTGLAADPSVPARLKCTSLLSCQRSIPPSDTANENAHRLDSVRHRTTSPKVTKSRLSVDRNRAGIHRATPQTENGTRTACTSVRPRLLTRSGHARIVPHTSGASIADKSRRS